jgi:hypothetical protein
MFTLAVGLALTTALLSVLSRRAGLDAADLGSMSTGWIAANRAGARDSSL